MGQIRENKRKCNLPFSTGEPIKKSTEFLARSSNDIKTEEKMTNAMGATNSAADSTVNSTDANPTVNTKISLCDLAEFAGYKTVEVPISYGTRMGAVYIFLKPDRLDEKCGNFYKEGLRNAINVKKYLESEKVGYDVGPAIAVASLIEDGDYGRYLKLFETENSKSNEFEHVFFVRENGHSYHILPIDDDLVFGNIEQLGLLRFSLALAFGGNLESLPKEIINEKIRDWILENNYQNAKVLREIIIESRVTHIDGWSRKFYNCVVYANLLKRIKEEFAFQQFLEEK